MSKTCRNCNNVFDDSYNICPRCGMQYVEVQQPAAGQYGQPNASAFGTTVAPVYPAAPAEQPMTLGQWVGTILLTTCLGTISLILLFIWGFSNTTPTTKKNYCRAMLIVDAIGIALGIIFIIIFFALLSAGGEDFFRTIEEAIEELSIIRS